MLVFSS